MWTAQLGAETTEAVLAGLLKEHPVTIRFRAVPDLPMETAVQAVQQALAAQGGTMEQHPYLSCVYNVSGTDDLTRLPYYHEGAFVVQDASSILAVMAAGIARYADKQTGEKTVRVLDLCAAPGGKSMLAADILEQCSAKNTFQYSVVSRDLSPDNEARMLQNIDR